MRRRGALPRWVSRGRRSCTGDLAVRIKAQRGGIVGRCLGGVGILSHQGAQGYECTGWIELEGVKVCRGNPCM